MFTFTRRTEPQRRPIGEPGISIEQYERITARIREEGAGSSLSRKLGPATQLKFQLSLLAEFPGHRPQP